LFNARCCVSHKYKRTEKNYIFIYSNLYICRQHVGIGKIWDWVVVLNTLLINLCVQFELFMSLQIFHLCHIFQRICCQCLGCDFVLPFFSWDISIYLIFSAFALIKQFSFCRYSQTLCIVLCSMGADKSLARPTSRCIFFLIVRIFRLILVLLYT
jgi:hypothetical protein